MWQAADDLARNMLRCGQSSEVKAIAPTLAGRSKSLMLQWLAEWQAGHSDSSGSEETLLQIKDDDIRRDAEFNIITARAVKGEPKTAEAAYRKLLEGSRAGQVSVDDLVAQDMSVIYAMKGDADLAMGSLEKMKTPEKVYAVYSLIPVLIEKQDKESAKSVSQRHCGL